MKPRPETAKRIEAATNGEVTAAELLGLAPQSKRRSVNEDPAVFEGEANVSITIPADLLAQCHAQGLDIPALIAEGGIAGLREASRQVWYDRNQKAIDANQAHIEQYGTFGERHGVLSVK